MGRGIIESGLFRSERYGFEVRTSDPTSTEEGEAWIRSDLAPEANQIGTLRLDRGGSTDDIPIFNISASTTNVEKALRPEVGGTTGFVPITDDSPAHPALRFQHNGATYAAHDSLTASVIAGSAIAQYDATQETGFNDGDPINSLSDFIGGDDGLGNGSGTYQTNVQNGNGVFRYNGSSDGHYSTEGAFSVSPPYTIIAVVVDAAQGASDESVFGRASVNDNQVTAHWYANGSNWRLQVADPSASTVENVDGSATSPPLILTAIVDGANTVIRENGSQTGSGTVTDRNLQSLNIGALNGNSTWHLNGDVGEEVVYGVNLSSTGDLASEEQRIADKWGITI